MKVTVLYIAAVLPGVSFIQHIFLNQFVPIFIQLVDRFIVGQCHPLTAISLSGSVRLGG